MLRIRCFTLIVGVLVLPALLTYTCLTASPAIIAEQQVMENGKMRNRTVSSFWAFDTWGRVRGTKFCEPLQMRSAVQEPTNAWSNLGYVVLGAVTIGLACEDALSQSKADVHTIMAHPWFACLMGLSWMCLGFFSFLFHAAHVQIFWILDVGFTSASAAALVSWSLLGLGYQLRPPPTNRRVQPWTVAMATALVLTDGLLINYKRRMSATIVLSTLVALVIFIEVIVQPLCCGKTRRQFGLTLTGLLIFLVAFLIRNAEVEWGAPLCLYSSWFQPHSVWHLLSAVAIACVMASWRSPFPATRPCTRPLIITAPSGINARLQKAESEMPAVGSSVMQP